mgnify:CR=1 FL=1
MSMPLLLISPKAIVGSPTVVGECLATMAGVHENTYRDRHPALVNEGVEGDRRERVRHFDGRGAVDGDAAAARDLCD